MRRYWMLFTGLALLFLIHSNCVQAKPSLKPLQPITHVSLERYTGTWYEIALIPYVFERGCARDAMINYTQLQLNPTVFKDVFDCVASSGRQIHMEGRAKDAGFQDHARLKATFLNLLGWRYWFGVNYWIIDLTEDYHYAVVAHPSRRYGWILARTPSLPKADLSVIAVHLKQQGYDPCRFQAVPQSAQPGHFSEKISLCQVIPPVAEDSP